MPKLRHASPFGLAAFLALIASAPPRAAPVDDRQAELVRLYTLSVAIDTCSGLEISDADEDKLDGAIAAVEAKLGLTEEASATLYTRLSAAADNDKDAFCSKITPNLKDALDKLPN